MSLSRMKLPKKEQLKKLIKKAERFFGIKFSHYKTERMGNSIQVTAYVGSKKRPLLGIRFVYYKNIDKWGWAGMEDIYHKSWRQFWEYMRT